MTIQEVLSYFNKVKQLKSNSYQCQCPCHNDKTASLTISYENNRILMHCHAGCNINDILLQTGLRMSDLYNEKVAKNWKSSIEAYIKKPIEAEYHYFSVSNEYLYSKLRFEGKDIRYGVIKNDRFNIGLKNQNKSIYMLPQMVQAVKSGKQIFFVEGEKDVDTLNKLGLTAVTCGSAEDWKEEFAHYFTGAKVVILPDNDDAGIMLKRKVMHDIHLYAHYVKWTLTSTEEKGDVTDYLVKEKHTKEQLLQLVEEATTHYAPWITVNEKTGRVYVNEGILAECVQKSLRYILLRRKDVEQDQFCIYENGLYEKSKKEEIKSYIRRYLPRELVKNALLDCIYNLLRASKDNVVDFEDIDTDENLINVKNGIYNIEKKELQPHSDKVYSTFQLNCNYTSEYAEPKIWLKYINDLCTDISGQVDNSKIMILQEMTGLILSNIIFSKTKKCLLLYSALGNTGKSIFINVISRIIGIENTINIPIQKLSDRFSLGDVYGKRLIGVGDQGKQDIQDSSIFKGLTGGDYQRCERKNKDAYDFLFKGGIFMACNDLPCFVDDKGGHVFERITLIKCTNVIPEEKRDALLKDKILKEVNGIFRWGLIGLHRLIANNYKFTHSDSCDLAMAEYRNTIDTLYAYIDEKCEITDNPKDRIDKTEFEAAYESWCHLNQRKAVHKRNIPSRMEELGIQCIKSNGFPCYKNIVFLDDLLL